MLFRICSGRLCFSMNQLVFRFFIIFCFALKAFPVTPEDAICRDKFNSNCYRTEKETYCPKPSDFFRRYTDKILCCCPCPDNSTCTRDSRHTKCRKEHCKKTVDPTLSPPTEITEIPGPKATNITTQPADVINQSSTAPESATTQTLTDYVADTTDTTRASRHPKDETTMQNGLTSLVIALIAIAAAVVLGIVVGLIIVCYCKNILCFGKCNEQPTLPQQRNKERIQLQPANGHADTSEASDQHLMLNNDQH